MTRIADHLQIASTGWDLKRACVCLNVSEQKLALPVTSDFSDPAWGPATGEVCDMVQVPAYLCRQISIQGSCRSNW